MCLPIFPTSRARAGVPRRSRRIRLLSLRSWLCLRPRDSTFRLLGALPRIKRRIPSSDTPSCLRPAARRRFQLQLTLGSAPVGGIIGSVTVNESTNVGRLSVFDRCTEVACSEGGLDLIETLVRDPTRNAPSLSFEDRNGNILRLTCLFWARGLPFCGYVAVVSTSCTANRPPQSTWSAILHI